ncbi:sensor histidine kinase [Haliangium ochraceum]|uniref:histidine kinase n=1 Tax=Haliangium ochraceum (strain DSM 14365 / JCM 11303 / SMP-2) TaxID=502025 RepID=D0LJX1_HALO1|nr:ATP-binding protein [Haliangium ochraceum]ACY18478.1 multi-sensor signal transduction histidine kinase [Haliangium ochraceum DSM 14365]
MKLGIRIRLFMVTTALILGLGLICGLFLQHQLVRMMEQRTERELGREAQIARAFLETGSTGSTPDAACTSIQQMRAAFDTPITLVDGAGRVRCDSRGRTDAADLRQRDEIARALAGERGIDRRREPDGTEMLHLALPVNGRPDIGAVRLSITLSEMEQSLGQLRGPLLLAGLLGLIGALLVSALGSHILSRTFRDLVLGAGSTGERSRAGLAATASDNLDGLAGSINRMADTVSTLAAERARFKAVLEGMNEAVITLDDQRRITLINHAAIRLLAVDGDPLGLPFIELVRTPAIHKLLAEGSDIEVCEFELPGTPPRRIQARITPPDEGTNRILVMHDVTDIRKLETVRRDFVANVSHELRTPVSIIRANSETLIDGAMSDPVYGQRLLAALHRNSERLSRLVDDLLDLSRLEANRYQFERDELSLAEAVRRAVDSVERSAQSKSIELSCEIDDELRVRTDPKALDQILVNYLDNAIKYTPKDGRVRIEVQLDADTVRVDVVDNGPGIAPQHRKRIFERFYRVDPGRSRDMGGTGLGLSIVKHLAESLEGDAGMEPAKPHGSRFWLSLPRA